MVAQKVERLSEDQEEAGSIPAPSTMLPWQNGIAPASKAVVIRTGCGGSNPPGSVFCSRKPNKSKAPARKAGSNRETGVRVRIPPWALIVACPVGRGRRFENVPAVKRFRGSSP